MGATPRDAEAELAEIRFELAERGVTELEVAVMAGNDEALRFYHRCGFRPSEELLRRPIAAKR